MAPIIADPKKLSMPQQVQKNKDDIADIKKVIDGLDSLDNVVIVPDMSHIMTAEELKSVRQPVCFIVYNDHLYIKKKEESGNAYFDIVFSIVATTVISFQSSEIEVNLSNGALGIINSTVSTYSDSKVDELLSLKASITYVDTSLASKANLSGANFTGGITAPSIVEDMTGYSFTKVTTINWTPVYVGVVKNGNKLTFVVFGSYTYHTGDVEVPYLCRIVVPQSVYDRLYPYTIAGVDNILDTKTLPLFYNQNQYISEPLQIIKYGSNNVGFKIRTSNLVDNTEYFFRIEATFLLSNNLAS